MARLGGLSGGAWKVTPKAQVGKPPIGSHTRTRCRSHIGSAKDDDQSGRTKSAGEESDLLIRCVSRGRQEAMLMVRVQTALQKSKRDVPVPQ